MGWKMLKLQLFRKQYKIDNFLIRDLEESFELLVLKRPKSRFRVGNIRPIFFSLAFVIKFGPR